MSTRRGAPAQVAKSIPFKVQNLITNSPDLASLNNVQDVGEALANRHFGKQFGSVFTSGNVTTTSSTFATIQTLVANGLPSGNYLLMFQGSFEKSLIAGKIETRFQVNGTPQATSVSHIPLPDDDFRYVCQSYLLVSLSGNNTITFQWRKSNGGGNIQVENRLLTIWRVS